MRHQDQGSNLSNVSKTACHRMTQTLFPCSKPTSNFSCQTWKPLAWCATGLDLGRMASASQTSQELSGASSNLHMASAHACQRCSPSNMIAVMDRLARTLVSESPGKRAARGMLARHMHSAAMIAKAD